MKQTSLTPAASGNRNPWSRTAEPTALAGVPLGLIRLLEERGVARAEILGAARLTEPLLADPDGRIAATHIWRLWRLAVERIPDADLGIRLAERLKVRDTGLLGYAILHSATVGQALGRLTRYSRILSESLGYRLQREPRRARLTLLPDPRFDALRHPIDTRLGGVLTVLREITGRKVDPLEVHLPYRRPPGTAGLRRHFRAPLRFGAPRAALDLRAADLDLPVTAADERLAGYLDRLAEDSLTALAQAGSLPDRIMRSLWSRLSDGVPGLDRIASGVGMSARTLQRRLRREGTTYARIVESLRRDMAARLLHDRDLAVSEVGYLLGYTDAASFHRAFRRWNARSPLQFRRERSRRP